jgi:hypothetical protein
MELDRGIAIHFTDGSSLSFEFPKQADNVHARQIMLREIAAERMLIIESDGALYYVPFDNIRYLTAYPAPAELPKNTVRGAKIRD